MDVHLVDHSVVQPDVIFISKQRRDLIESWVEGPPDLLVEVLSPGTASRDRVYKLNLYREHGGRRVLGGRSETAPDQLPGSRGRGLRRADAGRVELPVRRGSRDRTRHGRALGGRGPGVPEGLAASGGARPAAGIHRGDLMAGGAPGVPSTAGHCERCRAPADPAMRRTREKTAASDDATGERGAARTRGGYDRPHDCEATISDRQGDARRGRQGPCLCVRRGEGARGVLALRLPRGAYAGRRGDGTVRARCGRGQRDRRQADVHLRRQEGAQPDAPPGRHGAGGPRLPAEQLGVGAAAGQGLLHGALLSLRAPPGRPLPSVSPDRRRADR